MPPRCISCCCSTGRAGTVPQARTRATAAHAPTGYFQRHRPDRWDQAPLLRVDFLALREALGLSKDEKYISPLALSQAKIKLPDATAERPFVNWAEGLARRQHEGLTAFEDKALELAVKFWTYQDHRMGKRLAVVPIQGSDDQQWVSLADLVHSRMGREIRPDRPDAAGSAAVPGGSHGLPGRFCRGLQPGFCRLSGRHRPTGSAVGGVSSGVADPIGSRLQSFRPVPRCLDLDHPGLPVPAAEHGDAVEAVLSRGLRRVLRRTGRDAGRFRHARHPVRPCAGDEHVRVGGLRRAGDRRFRPGSSSWSIGSSSS